ncbi:MAG: aminotransferase class IV [Candidatus Omnitrophota bacterium]
MKIYLNDKLVEKEGVEEIFEPGFLFGWGVFETLRAYKGRVLFLGEHLGRLRQGLGFLELDYPEIDFKKIIDNLLVENNLSNAYVRITVYKKRKSIGVSIYADEFNYYKEDTYQKGFTVVFSPFIRYSQDPFLKIKSISYVKSRLAWHFAQKQGKDEAIFLNEQGFIQEGSRSSVFFVKDNVVFTPCLECGLLEGVTRNKIIDICKKENIKIVEGEFKKEDFLSADESFITSSLMEVMPIGSTGALTKKIHSHYKNLI